MGEKSLIHKNECAWLSTRSRERDARSSCRPSGLLQVPRGDDVEDDVEEIQMRECDGSVWESVGIGVESTTYDEE